MALVVTVCGVGSMAALSARSPAGRRRPAAAKGTVGAGGTIPRDMTAVRCLTCSAAGLNPPLAAHGFGDRLVDPCCATTRAAGHVARAPRALGGRLPTTPPRRPGDRGVPGGRPARRPAAPAGRHAERPAGRAVRPDPDGSTGVRCLLRAADQAVARATAHAFVERRAATAHADLAGEGVLHSTRGTHWDLPPVWSRASGGACGSEEIAA